MQVCLVPRPEQSPCYQVWGLLEKNESAVLQGRRIRGLPMSKWGEVTGALTGASQKFVERTSLELQLGVRVCMCVGGWAGDLKAAFS